MANGMTTPPKQDVYHRDNCIAPDIAFIIWTTNTKSARARARVALGRVRGSRALGRDGRMIDLRPPSGPPPPRRLLPSPVSSPLPASVRSVFLYLPPVRTRCCRVSIGETLLRNSSSVAEFQQLAPINLQWSAAASGKKESTSAKRARRTRCLTPSRRPTWCSRRCSQTRRRRKSSSRSRRRSSRARTSSSTWHARVDTHVWP